MADSEKSHRLIDYDISIGFVGWFTKGLEELSDLS